MDTVITAPVIDASLIGKGVAQHEEEADWKACFIGSVRPQSVYPNGYPHSTANAKRAKERMLD